MKNLWELWSCHFSPQWCDYVISKAMQHPIKPATIGFDGLSHTDDAFRSSSIRWLDVEAADADIADKMMSVVKKSNRSNFGFDITSMNEIQFTEYESSANGQYGWHHDVWFENPAPHDRKLSAVLQLSDPDEYTGGTFEFFNMPSPGPAFLPKGSVLIFPSFFPHRVSPVLTGTRKSLVTWIEGPKFR